MQKHDGTISAGTASAFINIRSQFYNQHSTKRYEVEAGPLTSDEAEWIDQLFTSYDVKRFECDDCSEEEPMLFADILVTDSDYEISDNPEKPCTAKLSTPPKLVNKNNTIGYFF